MIRSTYNFRRLQYQVYVALLSTFITCKALVFSGPKTVIYVRESRKDTSKRWLIVVVVLILCLLLFWPNGEVVIDETSYFPFEPDLVQDFPIGDGDQLKIPRIIHWTYRDTKIPQSFHDNVKSFVEKNPGWTFYLWTDEGSRKFIAERQPELLSTYDSYRGYRANIKRADFIRYVVLYEIGGIYVDLDVLDLRPLDRLLSTYTCIFPPEPFEHAVLRAGTPYLINNAIMICQPKHPFLKTILENIPRFQNIAFVNDATGPGFVTTVYKMYNNLGFDDSKSDPDTQRDKTDNSPYFYKGNRSKDDQDSVFVPNSQYFASNVDPKGSFDYSVCYNIDQLNDLFKRACKSLAKRRLSKNKNPYLFLEHQFYRSYGWYHFYVHWSLYLRFFAVDIHDLVPNIQIFELDR